MTSSDAVALYEELLTAAVQKLAAARAQNWEECAHYDKLTSAKTNLLRQAPASLVFDAAQVARQRNAIEMTLAAEAQSMALARARMSTLSVMIETTSNQRQLLGGYGAGTLVG